MTGLVSTIDIRGQLDETWILKFDIGIYLATVFEGCLS